MTWALLPLKDLVRAKTRLAGLLAPSERRALAQAMVEDVLGALTACSQLEGVLLVTDDPAGPLLAAQYGVQLLEESELGCHGLNPIISAGCDHLVGLGAESIMVVHSDLPLLGAEDLDLLLARFREPGVDIVLSPDRACGGTNVMLFAASARPVFCYGPDSCEAHSRSALDLGLRLQLEPLENVSLDVDEPADLLALCALMEKRHESSHTAQLLGRSPIRSRVALIVDSAPHSERGIGT